jgi:predicted RNA binding protein YcfA (HicA-like mRNA interferase family)
LIRIQTKDCVSNNDAVPATKVREVISTLEEDGWRLIATSGSHRHYKAAD